MCAVHQKKKKRNKQKIAKKNSKQRRRAEQVRGHKTRGARRAAGEGCKLGTHLLLF